MVILFSGNEKWVFCNIGRAQARRRRVRSTRYPSFTQRSTLPPGSRDLKRSSEETERCERRRAGAVLVWNNSQTEMASLEEVKALLFALLRGSPWAEGVLLNQDLAVRSTSILRDFHAYFLGALSNCLLDLVREP